jgi:hypothetical protein
MPPKKSPLWECEQAMSAFQVRPDWYEEYWLEPKKVSRSDVARWWRRNLRLCFILYETMVSALVSFTRTKRKSANVRSGCDCNFSPLGYERGALPADKSA